MQLGIRGLVGFHLNGDVVVAKQGLVALFLHLEGVFAGLQSAEHEHAVIVVVDLICLHHGTVLHEVHLRAVDRQPLVVGVGSIMVEVIHNLLVQVFHGTHDVASGLGCEAVIVAHAASHEHTLLSAPVFVECTVTCRLIGVEIALKQEARCAVFKHAEVACVGAVGAVACA